MEKVYNKLVRDNIPTIILNNGMSENPIIHTLSDEDYKHELMKKLTEEYQEVMNSKTKEELIEECADILEVVFAIANLEGYTVEQLMSIRKEKKEKRGGFEKRLFLEKVRQKQNLEITYASVPYV